MCFLERHESITARVNTYGHLDCFNGKDNAEAFDAILGT